MSVPKSKRPVDKLDVFKAARDHAVYVIRITQNQKNFDPIYKSVADKMIRLSIEIYTNLWAANNVLVKDELAYKLRRECQERACAQCNALLPMIDVAYRLYHLATRRVKYWTGNLIDVRNATRNWIKSDAERYKEYR